MLDYTIVILATVILAFEMVMSKVYQKSEGTSICAGLTYNVILGLACAVISFVIGGFQIRFSWFSVGVAAGVSVLSMLFCILSFRILKSGSMGLYSMFLMSGGMLLPYLFAVIFLDETLSAWRILGAILILAAVILSNKSGYKADKTVVLLCVLVFLLNGCVSIISKCHQIDTAHGAVSSAEFVMWTGIVKAIAAAAALGIYRRKTHEPMPRLKKAVPIAVGAAVFSSTTYLLQLIGAKNLPATVLYPIVTGGCIIFSTLAGKIFFKDKVSTAQWISVALCFAGTCLFL